MFIYHEFSMQFQTLFGWSLPWMRALIRWHHFLAVHFHKKNTLENCLWVLAWVNLITSLDCLLVLWLWTFRSSFSVETAMFLCASSHNVGNCSLGCLRYREWLSLDIGRAALSFVVVAAFLFFFYNPPPSSSSSSFSVLTLFQFIQLYYILRVHSLQSLWGGLWISACLLPFPVEAAAASGRALSSIFPSPLLLLLALALALLSLSIFPCLFHPYSGYFRLFHPFPSPFLSRSRFQTSAFSSLDHHLPRP